MLKSTFTPIFWVFTPKPKSPKLPSRAITSTFINSTPLVRHNASLNPNTPLPPSSAYIHLPFCRKRCHYCGFPIVALGSASTQAHDDPRVSNYIHWLCREISATKVDQPDAKAPLQTVYFGGGTPSLVPPKMVSSVLETLRMKFGLREGAEISMEMDPGTFDAEKMQEMVLLGVNRVSLGVQAFQEELLRACGRAHGLKEVHEAIDVVKSCGVENWSVDLIASLPHQTSDMWEESLRLTIESQPTHVSVYDLQIEQGTKFGRLYSPGKFPMPSEIQSAEFYKMASRMLCDANYNHYEISSYCKSGYECKHNYTYWKNKPFYGFGLGSASFVGGLRFSRPKKVNDYISFVQNLENGLANSSVDGHIHGKDTAMDVVMLSLRTARGLDLKCFQESFGSSVVLSLLEAYKPYVESGLVICLDERRRTIRIDDLNNSFLNKTNTERRVAYIRLSDPEGFLLSNELIALAFGVIDSWKDCPPY
ncbi:oxygen-independent coproporphyrinogen III oxidase [Spatholobus suberectus]|nr:oxygen-independent coproporphyrinogen III oxidase [Spatholobus suberectus]